MNRDALTYFQKFCFIEDCTRVHEIEARRSVPVCLGDAALLQQCARQAQWIPDYSHAMIRSGAFYALLEGVELLGDSGAIAIDGRIVVESQLHLKKLARSSSYRTSNEYDVRSIEALSSSVFYLPEARENIYHWLIDCLPRLWVLSRATSDPVTILCHAGMTDFQRTTLSAILVGFPNWSIQTIGPSEKLYLSHYIFPSFLSGLNSGYVSPLALGFLRGLLSPLGVPRRGPERIYLSRRFATQRRLDDDDLFYRSIEREGFVRVELELLSLPEQIALFRDAKIIVATHGAGLANMIFATKAKVIEMHPSDFCKPHYLLLARSCGHSYRYVVGSRLTADGLFSVDSDEVVRLASPE